MQCWISNVENPRYFFQDYSMNKKSNKISIYLKYKVCNNIYYLSKAWGQYFIKFSKEIRFIQQGFVKLIETVIVKIDMVRKLTLVSLFSILNKCCSFKLFYLSMNPKKVSQAPKCIKKNSCATVSNCFQDHALKNGVMMLKIQLWITEIFFILLK